MTKETDQQLVARVQAGDKRAFDFLVRKYQHKIAALVSRYIKDSHEVLDVTQEAFIKAYRAIGNFRSESAFYTWLYRIAINTAKNYLVSRGRRPPGTDIDYGDAEILNNDGRLNDNASPDKSLERDELEATVYKAINNLPDELRTAITLREMDGMSYEDIAQVMQCPVGTVRSRIFRAREAVDREIKRLFEPELVAQ